MKRALTWNGLSEYLDQRDKVMKTYGFAEDSQFMQVFMPGRTRVRSVRPHRAKHTARSTKT